MDRIQTQPSYVAHTAFNQATACVLCSLNCGLRVNVENNQITDITADLEHPFSKGHSCNKAYSIGKYNQHKQRVTQPLKRNLQGEFEPVSWDEAIAEIGTKLRTILDRDGGKALAIAGLGGQGNHLDITYGLSLLQLAKSPWWFSAYAQEKTQHALLDRQMVKAPLHGVLHPDPWNSDCLLLVGTNPVHSNRGYASATKLRQFAKDPKKILIAIDPRIHESSRLAKTHLPLKPGSDVWLFSGMLKHILTRQLYDQRFVSNSTSQFEQLQQLMADVDLTEMATRCELTPELIIQAAESYANAERGCIFYDTGIEWVPNSTLVSWLIRVLISITGNLCRDGGNHYRPTFTPNTHLLEQKSFTDTQSGIHGIPALGPFDMFSPNLLPEEIIDGPIRALIVEGANPLRSYSGSQEQSAALKQLELLVVIEPAMTETAMQADYVLPSPTGYEKWDWSTFGRHFPGIYAHLRPPVTQCQHNALPEPEIFHRIAQASGLLPSPPNWLRRLAEKGPNSFGLPAAGAAMAFIDSKASSRAAFARWVFWAYQLIGPQLPSPALASIWVNCQLFALTRRKNVLNVFPQWKALLPTQMGKNLFQKIIENPSGLEVARMDQKSPFKESCGWRDKKVRLLPAFIPELYRACLSNPAGDLIKHPDFPLMLAAGERSPWTANTIQRDPQWRKGKGQSCRLRIHPTVAEQHGLSADDWVRLETPWGKAELAIVLDKGMRLDNLSIPNGMGLLYPNDKGQLEAFGVNPNQLTGTEWRDEITGIPAHKTVPCRIFKINEV
ncbi:molybdopterin-containing oxidoreductase family protein [Pelagibaculum spongiae]|uniref:molybdopterin-containing oxidoreductase family protein n=1 Tax=Pelagibaculum spongiae TaxID=2080658 RepID=UPI0013147F94|nr:molybdopterin-dependent oxidoreductase [Pelagibaculum spongiae]